ncbi:hypothetical protein [Desulfobacula sp.]|uniref:hypothetical protein n=1 Tax=Desulfobacula sp. TaxID=2593537 RepID=UPI002616F537|nr:hypothetical protein [Desulfobacula sp.]
MKNSNDKAGFLGGVTASVTHELQNVLAIIKETSGLMEDFLLMNQAGGMPDLDERLGKCLETIKKQSYRGVTLTSRLNGFAHTSDSPQSTINIFETLQKMISITDRLFKQKGIDVSIIPCDTPYSIITDAILFQMIAFSCIECLIDAFQANTAIILAIQSSESQAAIQLLCNNRDLNHMDYRQKIIQTHHWEKINALCEQLGLKADISTDIPALLIFFK